MAKNFEATAALVRETVDYLARTAPGRSAETAGDILTQGFAQAAGVLFREMATSTGKLDWANPVSVLGYRKVIATVYTERIRAALEAAEAASGEDEKVRRALYEKAVSALSANAQREIGRYCGVANSVLGGTNMELSSRVKENAYETLMALARLRESITERTGVVMPGSIFLMLLLIWLRTANEQLAGWVKAAIKQDMTARLQQENADAIRSVSFVDVSDAIDQTLAQVEEMGVDNHMIWTQVGELLLQAVQGYVETEGSYATKMATSYVRSPSSVNLFRNVCVSLANMERAQTLISELISAIEDNLDKLAATASNGDEDSDAVAMRVNAAHDSLDIAVHDTLCACKKAFATTVGVLAKARAETVVAAFTANPADVRGATKTFIDVYDAALNDLNASTQRTVFNKILPVFADTFMDVFLAALRPEVLLVRGKKSGGNIFSVPLNLFKSTIVSAVGAIKDNNAFDDKIAAEMSKNAAFVPMYTAFFNEAIDYFENGISRDALTKNPTFTAVQQFAKIYNVSTETLISLHMRLTANQPLAQEEKALYGHVDADAIYTLIKYRDISGDRWADAYTDEKNGSDKSQKTREVLGLSQSEFFIAGKIINIINIIIHFPILFICFLNLFLFYFKDYKAFNAKYILTTKHLAYDPLVSRKETTVIDLLKITRMTVEGSVKKSLIVTVTGEVTPYKLNAPMSSDDFINEVTTQAIAAGNTFLQPKKKIKLPFQM